MFPRALAVVMLVATSIAPSVALAQCASGDLTCIELPDVPARPANLVPVSLEQVGMTSSASAPTPLADVGDVLPRGEYSLILNAEYYGLPPVSDGWVYMRVGQDALRVDWQSHEVLERVTERTAANF